MGCWEETCGLTNLPIYAGDEIVIVVYDSEKGMSPKDLLWGMYIKMHIEDFYVGNYDHYGWIDGIELDEKDRPDYRSVYFHKWAWDFSVDYIGKKYPEDIERQIKRINKDIDECNPFRASKGKTQFSSLKKIEKDFLAVCNCCIIFRKDPFTTKQYSGAQDGGASLDLMEEFIPEIQKFIKEKKEEWKKLNVSL